VQLFEFLKEQLAPSWFISLQNRKEPAGFKKEPVKEHSGSWSGYFIFLSIL
jgi:hypothetical protein